MAILTSLGVMCHYQNQWWPRPLTSICITKFQWTYWSDIWTYGPHEMLLLISFKFEIWLYNSHEYMLWSKTKLPLMLNFRQNFTWEKCFVVSIILWGVVKWWRNELDMEYKGKGNLISICFICFMNFDPEPNHTWMFLIPICTLCKAG